MKCQEFAAGYDVERRLRPQGEQFNELMAESREWSHYLGRIAHGIFSGDNVMQTEGLTSDRMKDYRRWIATEGHSTVHTAMAIQPPQDARRALNEFNFHELNFAMYDMWRPILSTAPWPSSEARTSSINNARDGLALSGVGYALIRKQLIEQAGGTEPIFEKPNSDEARFYASIAGKIQEFDSAIVLLDVMRRNPDITVIPAPMQFSNSIHQGRNVNFLAVHPERETAVGVQVMSKLTQNRAGEVDPTRAIFVDGDTDFNSVKAVRVKSRTSQERVVPWPGVIAAKSLTRIKRHGKGRNVAAARDPRALKLQFYARDIAGNLQVDFSDLSTIIGERVMSKLIEE